MTSEYWSVDDEVIEMAQDLIEQYHPMLTDARIAIVFRDEAPSSKGRLTLGVASIINSKWRPLLNDKFDFLIWLAHDQWTMMDKRKRRALLDHELCHCIFGKNGWTIRPHDIEEFHCIIQRHGLWNEDAQQMALAIQGQLFPNGEKKGFVSSVVFPEVKRHMEAEFDNVEVTLG